MLTLQAIVRLIFMSINKCVSIKGARVNNLKNIDIDIPRNKLVVITGLSGSGKSSLAFDTIYAEGQRRYVESLSSYARQFLGRMSKPECDFIKGIPPAIAIEQKVNSSNSRSTVGTSTEIYEYLRLLFARIGVTYSPISGTVVKKHSTEDVLKRMQTFPEGTRFLVLAPIILPTDRSIDEQLSIYLKSGFNRVEVNGELYQLDDILTEDGELKDKEITAADKILLVIDRLSCGKEKDLISRFLDSVEIAFYEGHDVCYLRFMVEDQENSLFHFSKSFEADGLNFEEPTDQMFAFNSPIGACPKCEGFGKVIGVDENLVIPNKSVSLYDSAVVCWRGEKMSKWKEEFIRQSAAYNFPIFAPYHDLTSEQKNLLWHGDNGAIICLDQFFSMLEESQYKIQFRVMLARYRGKTICPLCKGKRLKKEATYVKVAGKSITDLVNLSIEELGAFFDQLVLPESEALVAKRILIEITSRIRFLMDVGLGYLTLNRNSNTLSGGESQRIRLTTSLGSSLVGSLYILDEPSIGLHSRDTERLISVLRALQQLGNTVIIVEHDEEVMRAADYLIDIGPNAGRMGGEVVYKGDLTKLEEAKRSYTAKYLLGQDQLLISSKHRNWNLSIQLTGARENNLKSIDVTFPLNVMTVVTGVSGSGKSTLVNNLLYRSLKNQLGEGGEQPGDFNGLEGDIHRLTAVEMVDQNAIGKSSRSNPATYIKAYDDIRRLFSEQQMSKLMGYKPSHFSFNTDGGRCDECKGEGTVTVEMQFMADLKLVCESCHGKRFKKEILEVTFQGATIYDVLEMTVDQAITFFETYNESKIVNKLHYLQAVGLGYIRLGQSSSTLSGGENQRVKLARFLSNEKSKPTLYIFDEPTTGLHFYDIQNLLQSFDALIEKGHTVLIIEHNLDVIRSADYIIDLGPEGGDKGGQLLIEGTVEEVMKCSSSYTGKYLKEKFNMLKSQL